MTTTIAFFNNKGGVGKTSLAYHLAWMLSELDHRVVAVDLDPQANLSAMFLDEEQLEQLWPDAEHTQTVYSCVAPIAKGTGDISRPHVVEINARLGLVVGDLALAGFEADLSAAWPNCLDQKESAFRTVSAFSRIVAQAADDRDASVALIDVGPNLGAINRSALLAADFVVIPLAADLFSLQGLKNLGPSLTAWRSQWTDRLARRPPQMDLRLPSGRMVPLGYIVLQHAVRLDRPAKAYRRWIDRIPGVYRKEVLQENTDDLPTVADDPHCLASLKNYRSLMPYSQDARKPIFLLRPADGALGGHMTAVQNCYSDFKALARQILLRINSQESS